MSQPTTGSQQQAAAPPQFSDDRRWYWTGTQWVPVPPPPSGALGSHPEHAATRTSPGTVLPGGMPAQPELRTAWGGRTLVEAHVPFGLVAQDGVAGSGPPPVDSGHAAVNERPKDSRFRGLGSAFTQIQLTGPLIRVAGGVIALVGALFLTWKTIYLGVNDSATNVTTVTLPSRLHDLSGGDLGVALTVGVVVAGVLSLWLQSRTQVAARAGYILSVVAGVVLVAWTIHFWPHVVDPNTSSVPNQVPGFNMGITSQVSSGPSPRTSS